MFRFLRCVAFLGGLAALAACAADGRGQDKKEKKDKKGPAVELTDKAGKWGVWQAAVGLQMLTDNKTYALSALPKEMVGSTFLTRSSAEYGTWLPDGAVKVKVDATAYAMVRTKYGAKDAFGEEAQKLLVKDGWKEVDGKVGTTFPKGEVWEWKVFKKDVDEGLVFLQLKELDWTKRGTAVLFFFKEREKEKEKEKGKDKDKP